MVIIKGKKIEGKEMHDVLTLACPCFPGCDLTISTILQGLFLMTMWPPFLRDEACAGKVFDASDSPHSNSAILDSEKYFSCPVTDPRTKNDGKGAGVGPWLNPAMHIGYVGQKETMKLYL